MAYVIDHIGHSAAPLCHGKQILGSSRHVAAVALQADGDADDVLVVELLEKEWAGADVQTTSQCNPEAIPVSSELIRI